ncbi:MAG: hypothetical protein AAF970_19535 [Bacteroidota bacterium]
MNRVDHERQQFRNVMVYPQLQLGEAAKNLRHRFQWVSPIVVSPHDHEVVYHASQFVNRTTDGGMTWEVISPDLTTNNPAHQDYSGGPINHDITGVEIYNTVFSLAVSPHTPDVLWAGSDDGLLHITRDGGATWTNITPPAMPDLGTVDSIDPSVHAPGTAVVAVQRYRMDDFTPYIFRTTDYGASWQRITDGLPERAPVRVVREDPVEPGLLVAGTEFGAFVSFDAGAAWQPLQLNLPVTPITDLRLAHDDLILSTQGRSFWVLDDITPLRQVAEAMAANGPYLYAPRVAYRLNDRGARGEYTPQPRPSGAVLNYVLSEAAEAVTLEVLDADGQVVRLLSSDEETAEQARTTRLDTTAGMHRVTWNLQYGGPDWIEGMVIWGYTGGVKAPPGAYQVRLTVGETVQTQPLTVAPDPRLDNVTADDYAAQFTLATQVRDRIDEILDAIRTVRDVREQAAYVAERAEGTSAEAEIQTLVAGLNEKLGIVENRLMQTRNESNQDPIRFAPRLDNQYVELYNYITGTDGYIAGGPEGRPTAGAYERLGDLEGQWTAVSTDLATILQTDLAQLNAAFAQLNTQPITVPPSMDD